MSNAFFPEHSSTHKAWSSERGGIEVDWQDRFLRWWYVLTAVPEPATNESFVKRESARRIRLFSTVTFFFLIILTIFFPACFYLPNRLVVYVDGGLMGITLFTLALNRIGKPLVAGIILVVSSELLLTVVVLTTVPFDEASLQLFDLYLIIDLLAVSLIPPLSIFVLAACNSLFIGFDLVYQPHTPVFAHDLIMQFSPILVRPIGLQIIIAGVAYLWVRDSTKAVLRAERAERVAALEHALAEQKQHLEQDIQKLLHVHIQAANGNFEVRAPLTKDNVLWQVAHGLNNLLVRLQRATQSENELRKTEREIARLTEAVRIARARQYPIQVQQSGTVLDPLAQELSGNYVYRR